MLKRDASRRISAIVAAYNDARVDLSSPSLTHSPLPSLILYPSPSSLRKLVRRRRAPLSSNWRYNDPEGWNTVVLKDPRRTPSLTAPHLFDRAEIKIWLCPLSSFSLSFPLTLTFSSLPSPTFPSFALVSRISSVMLFISVRDVNFCCVFSWNMIAIYIFVLESL